MTFQETVPQTANIVPQTVTRPLSPRFASLERSLSDNSWYSSEPMRYDGESRTSPRILNKFDDGHLESLEINNNLSFLVPKFKLSPELFPNEVTFEGNIKGSGRKSNRMAQNMSVSLDKTYDSESQSITSKPLWQELQEANHGVSGSSGYAKKGESYSSPLSTNITLGVLGKGGHGMVKEGDTENNHRKLVSLSPTRLDSFTIKAAGGSANNSVESIRDESLTVNSLHAVDSSRSDSSNVLTVGKEKDPFTVISNDTAVSDLKQTPVESNMERKLISNLPKKLREEAVLRTFASNLKLASTSSKPISSKRQSLEGRQSGDSGRESVLEDETKPRLYRFDSSSSVSSVGSTRSAIRNSNGVVKPWSVVMVAETIKKRRQDAARKGKQAKVELETLKEKLEQSQAKANGLDAEIEPLREKLKRYEDIIEKLEDRIELSRQENLVKDRDYLAKMDKLERTQSKTLQEERIAREEMESDLKNKIRLCESEVKFYKKQVDELEDNLAMLKDGKDDDEENNPYAKQMTSLKKELVQVREVLSSSEKERLNERKEKLSALQNMIKLTKLKSDLEEELDERKKADTKETSEKYIQLNGKLVASESKLQKLREEMVSEIERLHKKHIEETKTLETNNEKENTELRKETTFLRQKLKDLEDQQRPSSPVRVLPYHGKWSAMRSESRKHTAEIKDIVTALEAEGLGPEQCSSEEVVRVLYSRQKDFSLKLKEAEDILSSCKNGDPRPVIQTLKDENKSLKRSIEDHKESILKMESQLKLVEMTSKRQIEDLLAEKKSIFIQLQKAVDDYDAAKGNSHQLQKEIVDTKSLLNKRQNELQLLRDNLLSVTNEMKTVDADLGKTRKDLSLKTAECERLKRDIVLESERVQQERKNNSRQSTELENKKKIIKDSDKIVTELEAKVQRLTENLEASQMHVNRVVSERDSLKSELQSLRMNNLSTEAELSQLNSVLGNVKNQVKSLEYALQDKVDKLAAVSSELEKAKADSLGANHLLGIEEERNRELEDDVEELTYNLTSKAEELENLHERIRVLEEELDKATQRFNSIQIDYAESETSLKSQETTKVALVKELNVLQIEFREVSREKQRLHEMLTESKASLDEKVNYVAKLEKDLKEQKRYLKEKKRILEEVTLERDRLQEKMTYENNQNQLLSETVDSSNSEIRKNTKEIEVLKSQLNEVTQGKEVLSDELERVSKEYKNVSEKQKEKLKLLQSQNEDLQTELKASMERASRFEKEATKLKSDLKETFTIKTNDKVTYDNEVIRIRNETDRELESDRRKHEEELKQLKEKHHQQKMSIEKLSHSLMESEAKNVQMEQFINEKESQLRMLTREKEQLADTVKFLESEIKNADNILLEKERDLNAIKTEKEREISSLKAKQELILDDLKEANEKLSEREDENVRNVNEVNGLMKALKAENRELQSIKSNIEETAGYLENELKKKENEKERILQSHKDKMLLMEENLSKIEEKALRQENLLTKTKIELGDKTKENSRLNKKVKELIEDSEKIGEQSCQVAQVQQVESAGIGYESLIAEEQATKLEAEKQELQGRLEEAVTEIERSKKDTQAKRKFYKETEEVNKRLAKEVERAQQEKGEALKCLRALMIDNKSMAKCIAGLEETVALQRQDNVDTKNHLREVLDRYDMQREVSFRTQRTYESVLQAEFARNAQDSGSKEENFKLKGDFEKLKTEKIKLAMQLENKDRELERTRNEVDNLRGLMEKKIVNFEVEKRARELLESKLQQFLNDKSIAQKRLISMEDSQKDLQSKFADLQKWHNSVEVNLINGISQPPLSIEGLYEDQERREMFLKNQMSSLNEKYKTLGIKNRFGMEQNSFKLKS